MTRCSYRSRGWRPVVSGEHSHEPHLLTHVEQSDLPEQPYLPRFNQIGLSGTPEEQCIPQFDFNNIGLSDTPFDFGGIGLSDISGFSFGPGVENVFE
jgi:hypothetical protein